MEAEQHMWDFKLQELANTAWAFAKARGVHSGVQKRRVIHVMLMRIVEFRKAE